MKYILTTLAFFTGFLAQAAELQYYSQPACMQDKWLNENIFKNKRNGVFVDVGAYGILYSNTYFYEKELGWTGICIEPNPLLFKKLQNNRNCICINACISDTTGEVDFLFIQDGPQAHEDGPKMLGGIFNKYDARHLKRIFYEVEQDKGTQQIIKVKAYTLNDILDQNGITHIDYLSIDTEGNEMDIIKSINYEKFDIDIIDVENNFDTTVFRDFLITKGFFLIAKLGHDEIYCNGKYLAQ